MSKIYFLSHSTDDASIVKKVATTLGSDNCWIYEWDIKPGDSIFGFDKGISDSRIFVLFWSINASVSTAVEDEISQARIRIYRDRGFRFVIVKLDNTPLPLPLAYRSYINGTSGHHIIATALKRLQSDLIPETTFDGSKVLRESFQDRITELDKLETLALSGDSPVMILGLDGMGKTSFMKKAESAIFSHLSSLWVDLATTPTPLSLLSAFAKPLSIQIDPHEVSENPYSVWVNKLLPEITDSKTLYVILDNLQIHSITGFTRSEVTSQFIQMICKDLVGIRKPKNPGIITISSVVPSFNQSLINEFHKLEIGQLDRKFMARALRYHLSQISSLEYDLDKLENLSDELTGYPASLEVIARRVVQQGIEATYADKKGLKKLRYSVAEELFSNIKLSDIEHQILVTTATSIFPLLERQMKMLFGPYLDVIEGIRCNQLLDPISRGYSVHNILRDYILESIASPSDIKQAHERLAQIFQSEWDRSLPLSADRAQYASVCHYHALSSGKVRWAKLIQSDYLEEAKAAAIELYRRGQYDEALSYLEKVKKMGGDQDPIFDFYYGLSLNRLNRSSEAKQIIGGLVKRFPDVSRYHHAFGTIQKTMGDKEGAIESFRKAIARVTGPGKVTSLCSLAEILTEMGNAKDAIPLVEQAIDLEPAKAFVVAIASMVYDAAGQTNTAIEIIRDGLKISPNDTRLHHRAGMLLKKLRQFSEAKDHLQQAVINPSLAFSITALADVYLELGEVNTAEQVLEKFPGNKQRSPSYLATKANILRRKGDFNTAEILLRKALSQQPKEVVHIGGLSQLKFDQAELLVKKGEKQTALICLEEAKYLISNGLKIDQNNEALLSIAHMVNTLEKRLTT